PGVRIVAAAVPGQRRGAAVGLYVAAFYLGSALSLGATGLLLGAGDWRSAGLVLGGGSVLAVLLGLGLAGSAPPGVERPAAPRPGTPADQPLRRGRPAGVDLGAPADQPLRRGRLGGARLDVLANGPLRRT